MEFLRQLLRQQHIRDGLLSFADWLRALRRQARRFRSRAARLRSYFPQLEPLENRQMPTSLSGITEYTIPTASANAQGITLGPDNNLWFVENGTNKIGMVTVSGSFTEYTIPTANSQPYAIVSGPDGNLWFTEANTTRLAR